jgi:hypothetical protein
MSSEFPDLQADWPAISRRAAARATERVMQRAATRLAWQRRIERANWLLAAAALLMIVQSSWAALNMQALVLRSTAALAEAQAYRDSGRSPRLWFETAPPAGSLDGANRDPQPRFRLSSASHRV